MRRITGEQKTTLLYLADLNFDGCGINPLNYTTTTQRISFKFEIRALQDALFQKTYKVL